MSSGNFTLKDQSNVKLIEIYKEIFKSLHHSQTILLCNNLFVPPATGKLMEEWVLFQEVKINLLVSFYLKACCEEIRLPSLLGQ